MKAVLILLMTLTTVAYAQTDVDRLLDANIFDPDRGKKPSEDGDADSNEEEVTPLSKDLPVLDGTLIVGDTRIALFTILKEGKPTGVKASVNGMVGGYKVSSIDREKVELVGAGAPVSLSLYSGQKESRGGSKTAVKVAKKPTLKNSRKGDRLPDRKEPRRGLKPTDRTPQKLPNAKNTNNKNKRNNRFQKRTNPRQKTGRGGTNNDLGKKF